MHSYADVIEMKRANVRNYALIICSLRASPHSNTNAKLRLRLVVMFSLVREELKAV